MNRFFQERKRYAFKNYLDLYEECLKIIFSPIKLTEKKNFVVPTQTELLEFIELSFCPPQSYHQEMVKKYSIASDDSLLVNEIICRFAIIEKKHYSSEHFQTENAYKTWRVKKNF